MNSSSSFALGEAHVGRVALRVESLARVVPFYREILGLEGSREGNQVRLGAGGTALLELQEAPDAPERRPEEAGLFHVAVRYPDRRALAECSRRIGASEYELTGASDHNVSESLYLRDPAGNGVELYYDRPRKEWPRTAEGGIDIGTSPLDLDGLSALAATPGKGRDVGDLSDSDGLDAARAPAATTIGHVHLEVLDLQETEAFYREGLGLGVQARHGDSAAFLAAGDYHHHLAVNTWNGRSERASGGQGLAWFGFVLPDSGTLDLLTERLADRGHRVERQDERAFVIDPDGTRLRLSTS